jgi:hypothetical protein
MISRFPGLAVAALAMHSILVSCTYNVTSPAIDEMAAVGIDPNLQVLGLERFKKTIETDGSSCLGATVELDYSNYALRLSQLAWQTARARQAVEEVGVLAYDYVEVYTECTSGSGLTLAWSCKSDVFIDTSFSDGDKPPVLKTFISHQATSLFTCGDTADIAQDGIEAALEEAMQFHFGYAESAE